MSSMNANGMRKSERTSSQRSIYDYPEHLNPFYEDENHKRLRFWKINSNNNNETNNTKKRSRSNSISFDGLKGLWSFKSFRLKKKSSTLGINKTSESPPMLRRDDDSSIYNKNSMLDVQMRHTVDVGLSNNFQRGAMYRSSLQDLNSRNQPVFFVRNHRYRNTVQNGNLASESQLRSSTPALQTRYIRPALSRGSSQTSVSSTNPFEDDYVDTVSQAGSVDGISINRSARKKRRAPQPPSSPSNNTVDKTIAIVEECLGEAAAEGRGDESVHIINLTAEIESFVRTAAHTDAHETPNTNKTEVVLTSQTGKSKQMRQSPESNDFYAGDECVKLTVDKIQNLGADGDYDILNNSERSKRSPVKILIREPTEEDNEDVDAAANANFSDEVPENKLNNVVEVVSPPYTLANGDAESVKASDEPRRNNECNTPTSLEVENILENENRHSICSATSSLRITESCDDLSKHVGDSSAPVFEVVNIPLEATPLESSNVRKELSTTSSRFEIRTVPLKDYSPIAMRKNSNSEIVTNGTSRVGKKEPPTPPRRTRSVKEIIESINKSQSLLKINQDLKTKDKIATANIISDTSLAQNDGKAFGRNLNESTAKNYYQQKKLFGDAADENGNRTRTVRDDNEFNNNIPLCVQRYNEFSKNNSILFKKCVVSRSRCAKDNGDDKSNVEWNPVPKPRRKHSP